MIIVKEKEQKKISQPEIATQQHPIKVLLVDDKPENLISLEGLLKKEGEAITYLFARSGEEALMMALKEHPALIMLDVQMPGMNGYEVSRFLRNNSKTRNIPIIFVTAIDHEAAHMVEGFEAGGVDFLFKPLHPFITKAKVNAFINFHIQQKEVELLNQKLEDKVKERTRELIKINNDLDNFIYTASHDLKAPISNIEGLMNTFFDVIGEDLKNSDDIKEIKGMIEVSVDRFKTTLHDLTTIAKVQSEEVHDRIKVNIQDMTSEIKSSIKDLIKETHAEIIEDFSEAPSIYFSRKNLRSIIYNLLSNAIKYRSPKRKPKIEIKTEKHDGGYTLLKIIDNGLGMNLTNESKIFSMFKRLHDHVEGSGIGLYLVKRIMDNAGGRIEVESQVEVGSVFKLYFKEH